MDIKINELIEKGIPIKKMNPEYNRLIRKQKGKSIKVDKWINQNQNIRVEYIRYADDFIIGCTGTRGKAEEIKEKVINWLKDLKLEIAYDKSKIVTATKGIRFLSYMIKVKPTASAIKKKTTKKTLNGKVRTLIPKEEVNNRCHKWTKKGKIIHDTQAVYRDRLEIIRTFKRVVEGIVRYFAYGENLSQLTKLAYIAEYSCLKTLANKEKTSLARVRKKLNIGSSWGVRYTTKNKPKYEVWPEDNWEKIKRMRNYKGMNPDIIPNPHIYLGRTHLTDRLKAEQCELCQTKDCRLEIHHTKTVRNRNWRSILNKETMALCKKCHRFKTNQQINNFNQKQNKNK
ncbi:MAG: group II intron reverse transcriptase/maturase ['Waltheria sp.' little leaf phytoplasma]|nr:group II intron reverse transcriptase/maturase ['Waltheria sp.' little leaf phytoplasma]